MVMNEIFIFFIYNQLGDISMQNIIKDYFYRINSNSVTVLNKKTGQWIVTGKDNIFDLKVDCDKIEDNKDIITDYLEHAGLNEYIFVEKPCSNDLSLFIIDTTLSLSLMETN